MAWIPSHQSLRDHPKTRKAARRLGVTLPTMIGHLHLLWYWALDLAPDGDVSKFDDDDLSDAADWTGDPATFVAALVECGPGGTVGFIDSDRRLHDWDEYGGKVAAADARRRWRLGERGLVTPSVKTRVLNRYKRTCGACGSTDLPEVDHYMPIALGGSSDESNLWVLCRPCNRSKGAKHPNDWNQ